MKLQKWALISEIVSGVAIVVTLAMLIFEVREGARQTALNTQALQVSAYEELTGRMYDLVEFNVSNPNISLGLRISRAEFERLTVEEQRKLTGAMSMRIRFGDFAFYQRELGMLSDEYFEAAMSSPVSNNICSWLFRDRWATLKMSFVSGYREYIDSKITQC